jgi:hypothetical protein
MFNFIIKSITCSEFAGRVEFHVVVNMPAKDWLKAKAAKQLGHLYGVDISNAVHRQNEKVY